MYIVFLVQAFSLLKHLPLLLPCVNNLAYAFYVFVLMIVIIACVCVAMLCHPDLRLLGWDWLRALLQLYHI